MTSHNNEAKQMQTITVSNSFGRDKEITREEFIRQWVEHVGQMHRICETEVDMNMVRLIKKNAEDMAARSFDETYKRQMKG